jgi:hypothetical protein
MSHQFFGGFLFIKNVGKFYKCIAKEHSNSITFGITHRKDLLTKIVAPGTKSKNRSACPFKE